MPFPLSALVLLLLAAGLAGDPDTGLAHSAAIPGTSPSDPAAVLPSAANRARAREGLLPRRSGPSRVSALAAATTWSGSPAAEPAPEPGPRAASAPETVGWDAVYARAVAAA